MPVAPDTQFSDRQAINVTNFSLILSPIQTSTPILPLLTQMVASSHYSALCFSHLIYLGGYILINNTLQQWPLTTSYGQNSANVSYLY